MYQKHQLPNGFKIIVSPMPQMASVSMGIWIGTGGRYEEENKSGISHFIEHMLFKGTRTRSAKDLKESIEGIGGSLNGFTADEVTCYMFKVPAKHLKTGVDVLADMVVNPRFDKKDMIKERFVICEEIKMYKDQPAERVHELLEEIMWPDDPLGRPLTGTIDTVKSFTRDDLISCKEESYYPSNMALIASGKVTLKQMVDYAAKNFSGKRRKKEFFKTPKISKGGPRTHFSSAKTQQAHIAMGFPVENNGMKERYILRLMNIILGGNMSSRLFEELREKKGLCYDIASSYKRHRDIGEFGIHAGVDNGKTAGSVVAMLNEIRKLKDEGVAENELKRAKEFAKGQFLLGLESTSSRMLWLGDKMLVDGKIPDVENILKKLDSITAKDIIDSSRKIFRSGSVSLAVISKLETKDKNSIIKELKNL